jgi:type I restriction enzyme S subunit
MNKPNNQNKNVGRVSDSVTRQDAETVASGYATLTRPTRLKFICRLGYGNALPKDEESSGDIPVFGSNGQYSTTSGRNTLIPAIVVGRKGSYGKVNWASDGCFASDTTFFIDSNQTSSNLRWLYWVLQTLKLDEGSQEAAVPGLNRESVYEQRVIFPDQETQHLIANYLDRETAHIDALVAEKEKMLALLEEKRAALISRAVTRGLNPDAQLKPSGLDWLGDIPAHWSEPRAKGLFHEVDIRTDTGEETLLSLRMEKGLVPHNEVSNKELEPNDIVGFKKIYPGQMVINRMRAASGLIAVATEAGLVSPDYAVFDVLDQTLCIQYFLELFKTSLFQAIFRSSSKGLGTGEQGFLRLYTESFLSLHFPYPPVDEQREIVAYINHERNEMLHMEHLLQHSIDLAKERRAALITAAVTGQIPIEAMRP